ncbi:hypothetical protein [Leptothoe sp. PORK10 BA2]|uniref:hypothetical protein n=1 Tax=Leptothoe sp. PORK10 BA2 TaxID=3110254 RepID=UPI002B209B19|nr:hypothetical protein [Leptothoe sp. PORK10 BA2]MEA5464223.1 hypothetical protein [Leptothoe sp. PORK10 BA2]
MGEQKPINVTNKTGAAIDLYDVFKQGDSADAPVVYTPLGSVAAGATASIKTLHAANHIVAMQTGPLSDPVMGPQVNFPVKVIAVLSFSKERDFTVSAGDKAAMEQTFRFVRYISANPSSTLAAQFQAAMEGNDQTNAVNAFFAGSKTFNLCTLSTWTTIMSWQAEYLSAWQGNYYLYDMTEGATPGTLVAGAAISLADRTLSAKLAMADADGKWSAASQPVALAIAGGVVSETPPGGAISASLRPVWMPAIQTKGKTVNHVIAPTLSGTVGGKKVLGNFKQISPPSKSAPQASTDLMSWLDKHAGLLVSAGMLYIMYKQWQEGKQRARNEVAERDAGRDPQDVQADIDAREADVDQAERAEVARAPHPDAAAIEASVNGVRAAEGQARVGEVVDVQQDRLMEVLADAPASPAVENAAEAVEAASDAAGKGDVDGALKSLDKVSANVDVLLKDAESSMSKEARSAAEEVKSDIAENEHQVEEERKIEEERASDEERGADDDFADDEFSAPEEAPIEFGV